MKRLLTSMMATALIAGTSSLVSAGVPAAEGFSLDTLDQMSVVNARATDTMLAQCYGRGGYGGGWGGGYYEPVYRTRRVYAPVPRGGLNINIGGGRRGFHPGYYRDFGPRRGYGPGFGRSGVGLFLNF